MKFLALILVVGATAVGITVVNGQEDLTALQLPPLPYAYDALEPYIDEATMRVHHDKHHLAYTTKTNAVIDALEKNSKTNEVVLPRFIRGGSGVENDKGVRTLLGNLDLVPADLRTTLRNNGGGYLNHIDFWSSMTPNLRSREIPPNLTRVLVKSFGSVDKFKEDFLKASLGIFGSGWCWLLTDKDGNLSITTTPNQDRPDIAPSTVTVLLALDIWEHSYYLKFKNNREEYIKSFFRVADFEKANKILEETVPGVCQE